MCHKDMIQNKIKGHARAWLSIGNMHKTFFGKINVLDNLIYSGPTRMHLGLIFTQNKLYY